MNWIFFGGLRQQGRAGRPRPPRRPEGAGRAGSASTWTACRSGRGPRPPGSSPSTRRGWSRRCGAGPESPFWKIKGMSVVNHLADFADVPVLHLTGWYDSWTRQVAMNYRGSRRTSCRPSAGDRPVGPRRPAVNVAGEVEFLADAAIDLDAFRLRWYDRWLLGKRNGVNDDPPVLIYVDGDRRRPEVARRPAPPRRLVAGRRPGRSTGPARSRSTSSPTCRSAACPRRRGRDHVHLRPRSPRADDRRQHLLERQPDGQRRLRPRPRKDTHAATDELPCPSVATSSASGPPRWPRPWR